MLSIPQRLLGEALLNTANLYPNKTAIIVKEKEYSYDLLCESSRNLALYLIEAGVQKGDRVAIYLDNSWESIVSVYGVTLSGAVFLFINPQTKSDKLNYILNDSGAKIFISSSNLYNEFSIALQNTKYISEVIIVGNFDHIVASNDFDISLFDYAISNNDIDVSIPNIIPNDLAALIYTSGSTGFPKGVMMTHQSMVFASWSLIEYLRLCSEDRIMLMLPLAFDYGLYQLLMSVTIGGTFIVEQSFIFTSSIFKNIEKYQPTVFPGVPTVYAMMIAANKQNPIIFNSIQKVTNTAAALPAEFIPELKKIFPNSLIFKMYGLTECKRVCYLEPELIDLKPTSVGKAIPGTEIFLLSTDGNSVSIGEPGILHIRGPHIMAGYWHKEELSNEMLRPGYIPG
jgi:long-chain acyl-CoA synthetase